jgi:hypothetical protein
MRENHKSVTGARIGSMGGVHRVKLAGCRVDIEARLGESIF